MADLYGMFGFFLIIIHTFLRQNNPFPRHHLTIIFSDQRSLLTLTMDQSILKKKCKYVIEILLYVYICLLVNVFILVNPFKLLYGNKIYKISSARAHAAHFARLKALINCTIL